MRYNLNCEGECIIVYLFWDCQWNIFRFSSSSSRLFLHNIPKSVCEWKYDVCFYTEFYFCWPINITIKLENTPHIVYIFSEWWWYIIHSLRSVHCTDTEAVEDLRDIPRITLYIKYVYSWVYDMFFFGVLCSKHSHDWCPEEIWIPSAVVN